MIDQRAVIASGDQFCTTERERKPEPNSKIRTLTNEVGNGLVHKQHSIATYLFHSKEHKPFHVVNLPALYVTPYYWYIHA